MLSEKLPIDLDRDEIFLYEDAVASYPQSGGIDEVSKRIYIGGYRMFVIENADAKTIAIVTIETHPDSSRDLLIVMLSGAGSIETFDANLADLLGLAKREACNRLTGLVKMDLWEKVVKRGGHARTDHVFVSFDVPYGGAIDELPG